MAQDAATTYTKMAPVDQYLMADRDAEIAMARSAAPDSISRGATILVLGRRGHDSGRRQERVCLHGERSWMGPFGWPEFWNLKEGRRLSELPAARSILPIAYLRTKMMAGRSKAEIVSALKAAFENKQLSEPRERRYGLCMMSKSAYLTDEGDHNGPHPMFYTLIKDSKDWGSGAAGSPVLSSPYWSFAPKEQSQVKGLPPILVFLVMLTNWSDGTPAGQHHETIQARFGGESSLAVSDLLQPSSR